MKTEFNQRTSIRKKNSKICFDEEVISKDQAAKFILEQALNPINPALEKNEDSELKTNKTPKKRKIPAKGTQNVENFKSKKIRTSEEAVIDQNLEHPSEKTESAQESEVSQSKKESNRSRKRKKHAQLVEQKKLNAEVVLQLNTLNYLSKWKHSRSAWKFEKLKQVWIQQNLFDENKIPDEFWETTVEYFHGAKGYSRQAVLDEALKIIENEDEEKEKEEYEIKLKRARSIVQNLQ